MARELVEYVLLAESIRNRFVEIFGDNYSRYLLVGRVRQYISYKLHASMPLKVRNYDTEYLLCTYIYTTVYTYSTLCMRVEPGEYVRHSVETPKSRRSGSLRSAFRAHA